MKEIQEFAASVLSSPYDYSDNWEIKWGRKLETQELPDLNFLLDSHNALKRFKLKKVMRLCEHNQDLIKKASENRDDSTMMKHLKIHQKLIEMRNSLAKELNTVILK